MTTPKVSVIVPVYNTDPYLKRCLDSITAQTLQDIEIILVDDGSKEPCARLCDTLAATDARIKVIHKQNGGLGFARNSGLAAATGEFVGFVDSDDYISPLMYEHLYTAAQQQSADLVVCGLSFVGGNMFSKTNEYLEKPVFATPTVFENDTIKNLLLGVVGALPNEPEDSRYGASVCKNLFKKSVIDEHAIAFLSEREVLSEDTLFMVDFLRCAQKAVGIPGAYYCYCRNGDSLSKSYNPARFEKSIVFLTELENHLRGFLSPSEYQLYIARLTQGFGRVLCSQELLHANEHHIPFSAVRKRLREICTHPRLKNVLKTYPWHRLPKKQALFAFTMKYRFFFLQKILVSLRNR